MMVDVQNWRIVVRTLKLPVRIPYPTGGAVKVIGALLIDIFRRTEAEKVGL